MLPGGEPQHSANAKQYRHIQSTTDSARIKELQEHAAALTAEVAALQPLAPKAATLEAENASLEGRLERLDELLQVGR